MMQFRPQFVLLIGLFAVVAVGCGKEDTFDHTAVQKLFTEAMKARPVDPDKCVDLLTQVIDSEPMEDAYFHRAWIYAKKGSLDKATPDVAAGLEIAPEHPNLLWLDGELKKPAGKRDFKTLPSDSK